MHMLMHGVMFSFGLRKGNARNQRYRQYAHR